MVYLKDLELRKRKELCEAIASVGITYEDAKKILESMEDESLLEITAPWAEELPLQRITIEASHSGRYRGKSYKSGNIIINIKNAVVSAMGLGTSLAASIGAISISEPVLGILTIITAILNVVDLSKIALDDNVALVLAVLWENRYLYNQSIGIKEGYNLVNEKLNLCKRDMLSEIDYNDLLEDLRKIECIEIKDGEIILKEKVHILY